MRDILFLLFILGWFITGIVWVVALFVPSASLFKIFGNRFQGRGGLTKLLLPLSLVLFVGALIVAPPTATELKYLNLQNNQEVISEVYTIEGEVSGSYVALKINDENIEIKGSKFSKEVDLEPGENEFKLLLVGKDKEGNETEILNETYGIYFDYEGMLYARELEEEKRQEEELQRKLAKVPSYEIVRKSDIGSGFSAIIYVSGDLEDYLLSNAVKEIKAKNAHHENLTLLVISKSDKEGAEAALEGADLTTVLPYVRANYEKREGREELFWFPEGAEGKKLALEIAS